MLTPLLSVWVGFHKLDARDAPNSSIFTQRRTNHCDEIFKFKQNSEAETAALIYNMETKPMNSVQFQTKTYYTLITEEVITSSSCIIG